MRQKPTPERYCSHCGSRLERKRSSNGLLEDLTSFGHRKYCDRHCMSMAFDQKPVKMDSGWSTAHYHSRKLVPPGPCSICGKPNARDVHHKDHDHQNNSPENLGRICRSCHNREHRGGRSCVLCGKPVKGLGYCEKHYQRFKKYGDPLMFKRNQHSPLVRLPD